MDEWEEIDDPQEMQLELKAPVGKPPFVGVRFRSAHTAANSYKEVIQQYGKQSFSLQFEPYGKIARIRLTTEGTKTGQWWYNSVKYDISKLRLFLAIKSNAWTFGHIFEYQGKDQVAKILPENKLFVIRVGNLSVLGEY